MAEEYLFQLAVLLIVNFGLAAVIGLVLGKTGLLEEQNRKVSGTARYIAGILIFGILSVIGTATTMTYAGTVLHVRDAGPIAGGLWFGPVIGIGAGMIGVAYRFTLGGPTMIPCCISTILAGVVSGLLYLYCRQHITVLTSAAVAFVLMLIHLFLAVVLTSDGSGYTLVFETYTGIGLILLATISVALFSWCYNTAKRGNTA